jgi:hypothetical protein
LEHFQEQLVLEQLVVEWLVLEQAWALAQVE